jgi:MFS family permease
LGVLGGDVPDLLPGLHGRAAPPRLADLFGVSVETIGLIVTAYLIPYGAATLVYGPLSDRFGRGRIILASLLTFIVLTAVTATAWSAPSMALLRLLTGLGASGVVPIALTLLGSTTGVILEPFIGWRGLFLGVAALGTAILVFLLPYREPLRGAPGQARTDYRKILAGYLGLLAIRPGPAHLRLRAAERRLPLGRLHLPGGCTSPGATAWARSASGWPSSATGYQASSSGRSSAGPPTAGDAGGCCPRAS